MIETSLPFGAWLRSRRREMDLTQEGLAARANCSVDMVKKSEAGRARPSRQLALILAAALDVPADRQQEFVQWARGVPAQAEDRTDPDASPSAAARGGSHGASPAAPGNLPLPLTSMIGRTQ